MPRSARRKIMEWKKILFWSASAAMLVIIILFGFQATKKGRTGANESMGAYDNLMSKYGSDVEYSSYDGGTASGSEVIDLIKSGVIDGVSITVVNGENQKNGATVKSVTYSVDSTAEDIAKIYDVSERANYINPKANFTSSVTRDENGIIDSVLFTQK